jgi:hypothetical protein
MTERERMDRATLLRRAAAVGGALYAAPALTSFAAAHEGHPCRGRCKAGDAGGSKCRARGGEDCRCSVPPGKKRGQCRITDIGCGQDERCGPQPPCGAPEFCARNRSCTCLVLANSGGKTECVDFPSQSCADYPPCDKQTGTGCPVGMCCLDSCCAGGICSAPCYRANGGRPAVRGSGGPALTL